jgi:formylglycine-generating enzyme required for sulfatase activity
MSDFDPYHIWLGIPETERPISKYRLLAIADFENNREVISAAAERQTIYLRTLQAGEHEVLVADLLNEVSQARVTLLNAEQKAAYDEELRKQQTPDPVPEPTPPPIPVVQTLAPLQNTPLTGLVTGREPITQNRPQSMTAEWSTFQPDKRPRRRGQKEIWKRPAVIGICLVGTIFVFVLLISLMSSGDAEPVASNTAAPISAERAVETAVAEKTAAEKAAAITAALATGDWKAVLALDADNSEGLLMQVAAEKAAMEKAAAEKATILVGDPITDTLNMTFNKIPAGTFLMGSPEKYKAILHLGADPAEQRIIDELDNETRMTFVNTPLKDVINTIKSNHRIPIIIDYGVDFNSLYVTVDLKGISFRTGLKQMLNNLSLTYLINDQVLKIMTPEAAQKETTYRRHRAEQAAGQIAFLCNEHQHEVIINKAFYMQTTEVTQSQWTAVMGTEPWKGNSYVKEDSDYPATNVSWDDAVAFSKKLSEKEGETYRLPTEAEWEYACRAGAETRWSFGNDEKAVGDYAWYRENAYDIDEWYAHQVGLKKPNAFGLYDMHGNVWEWCHDPSFHTSGFFRVLRGGSWYHFTRSSRSARRHWVDAGHRSSLHGFRVVRELD